MIHAFWLAVMGGMNFVGLINYEDIIRTLSIINPSDYCTITSWKGTSQVLIKYLINYYVKYYYYVKYEDTYDLIRSTKSRWKVKG